LSATVEPSLKEPLSKETVGYYMLFCVLFLFLLDRFVNDLYLMIPICKVLARNCLVWMIRCPK